MTAKGRSRGQMKRAIEIAHRRWGKDDPILHRTAIAAQERPASYWHCLPEYAQARKALWAAVNPHTGKRRIDDRIAINGCTIGLAAVEAIADDFIEELLRREAMA